MKTYLGMMRSKDFAHPCEVFVGDKYGTSNQPCVRALSRASSTTFPSFKCFTFLIPIEDRSSDGDDLGFERISDWLLQKEVLTPWHRSQPWRWARPLKHRHA